MSLLKYQEYSIFSGIFPLLRLWPLECFCFLNTLTLNIPAVDRFDHQFLFLCFSQKFFPATYDKTLCKFLLYTYEDSHNLFWSKIISREHVEYIYVAWVENVNFKICNFRVLRSILEGFFIKQKLFKIKKY